MAPYKTIFGIATVMALRMIGLFMVMPLLALYVTSLSNTTPLLVGIALGIYGLTQACFQIPFGVISDFRGRKPVIIFGLLLFASGSLMAASAHSIYLMIAGRALQGAGAVGSTLMALLSDLTNEKNRSQAMAIAGGIIGVSFSLSIILGPILNTWLNVSSIFALSGMMGVLAIGVLLITIPHHKEQILKSTPFSISAVILAYQQVKSQKQLVQYNLYSMLIHMVLVMNFIGAPVSLNSIGMVQHEHWKIYLPILLLSFAITLGWIMLLQKRERLKFSMLLSVGFILLSQIVLMLFSNDLSAISSGLLLFFVGFNFLEATLPSEISKKVDAKQRGMAMGFYSTTQFLGIFLGGLLGGVVSTHFPSNGVFILGTIVTCTWFILINLEKHTWLKVLTKQS